MNKNILRSYKERMKESISLILNFKQNQHQETE